MKLWIALFYSGFSHAELARDIGARCKRHTFPSVFLIYLEVSAHNALQVMYTVHVCGNACGLAWIDF